MNAPLILPEGVYCRSKEPDQLPADLRLIALEWALYFAVSGTHTAAELGRRMRVEAEQRDRALTRLLRLGLISEQPLSASEYVRARAAAGDHEEKTLREFLLGATRATLAQPAAAPSDAEAAGAPPLRQVPALVDPPPQPRATAHATRPVPPLAFKPLPPIVKKESSPMTAPKQLSLRALMHLIETRAGNREAGELDIYRVFIRVDTALLRRSGIESLRFSEDRLVSDPELEQAIVRSVKKTLGLDCPESIWVEVA